MRDTDWMQDAACKEMDTNLFFSHRLADRRKARNACAKCPVIEDCLRYATERRINFGMWGGIYERHLRAYRRRLAEQRAS